MMVSHQEREAIPFQKEGERHVIFGNVNGNLKTLERFLEATRYMKKNGYLCLGNLLNTEDPSASNACIEKVRTTYHMDTLISEHDQQSRG